MLLILGYGLLHPVAHAVVDAPFWRALGRGLVDVQARGQAGGGLHAGDHRLHRAHDGSPGKPSRNLLISGSQERELTAKVTMMRMRKATCSCTTSPGRAAGRSLERDPARVLRDVLNEPVGVDSARDDYGAVVDLGAQAVDEAATARRRAELRAARGPSPPVFNR
jgi:hypothetical protein